MEDERFEILKEVSMNVDPQKRTMEEFKKRITVRFSDSLRNSQLMSELMNLKQGHKLDDYIFTFRKLSSLFQTLT